MTPSNATTPTGGRPEALWYGAFLLALGAVPLLVVHLVNYAHISALPVLTPAASDARHRSVNTLLLVLAYLVATALLVAGFKWARIVASGLVGFAVFGAAVGIGDSLNYVTLYGLGEQAYAFAAGSALALSTIALVLFFQAPVNAYLDAAAVARRRARAASSAHRRGRTGEPIYSGRSQR